MGYKYLDYDGLKRLKQKLDETKMPMPKNRGTSNQVLRSDGVGGARWEDEAPVQELLQEVDSWLESNVNIPEGGVVTLDPTLTSSQEAAQAKATGDRIKEIIEVSDDQPEADGNMIWIKETEDEVLEIPTFQEFEEFSNDLRDTLIHKSNNLIDPAECTENKRLNTQTGAAVDYASYSLTDYIEITSGGMYTLLTKGGHSGRYISFMWVFYDQNKAPVLNSSGNVASGTFSSDASSKVTAPSKCYKTSGSSMVVDNTLTVSYIRIAGRSEYEPVEDWMFIQYQTTPKFEPFYSGYYINYDLIKPFAENYIALEYSPTKQYAVNDYCTNASELYRCTSATTGTWDRSKWENICMTDEFTYFANKTKSTVTQITGNKYKLTVM